MPKSIVILHFQPLELYPPVMNLVNYMGAAFEDCPVVIISTHCMRTDLGVFYANNRQIKIIRLGRLETSSPSSLRYLTYLYFYVGAFFQVAFRQPAAILYYETLSAYPAYLYKKYCSFRVALFIHYHEYTAPAEYATGMKLVRYFHKKEKALYHQAEWVSHTNGARLSMFREDEGLEDQQNLYILPNYPSLSWQKEPADTTKRPLQVVYAGALSMNTMYTEDFARWVQIQDGKVLWDIYSNNDSEEVRVFFHKLNSPYIRLLQSVDYTALKNILSAYTTGVILYNGHLVNYVYNAPNKLFEYLACGLDVWFPEVMTGCLPYATSGTYPRVAALNFAKLDKYSLDEVVDRQGLAYKPSQYFYENVYPELAGKLINCCLLKSRTT